MSTIANISKWRKKRVKTENIKVGDTFITPTTKHPYIVTAIEGFTRNDVRGWERKATCRWLDTNVPFVSYFRGEFWTLEEQNSPS